MRRTPFIWLGSKRTRRHKIGGEARLLDVAAAAGLPVPSGAVLLDEFYRLLLTEQALQLSGGKLTVIDPDAVDDMLFRAARFPRLDHLVNIRPLFAVSSGSDPASVPTASYQPQMITAPRQLAASLADSYNAAFSWEDEIGADPGSSRRDLLVMKAIEGSSAGVVISQAEAATDMVQYAGSGIGQAKAVDRLRLWRQPDKQLPPQEQRLQRLMRGIRRTFKDRDWSIEWADDGRICWLTGIAPVPPSGHQNSP